MRLQQAELAFIGPRRPDEAVLRETRRGDAGDGAPARVEALGPGAFLEEDLQAGGGARRDALGGDDLLRRQAEQLAGDDGAAEVGDDAGGVEAGVVETALRRRADADR